MYNKSVVFFFFPNDNHISINNNGSNQLNLLVKASRNKSKYSIYYDHYMPRQTLELLKGYSREVHGYLHKWSYLLTVLLNALISIHKICLWNSSITRCKVPHRQPQFQLPVRINRFLYGNWALFIYLVPDWVVYQWCFSKMFPSLWKKVRFLQRFTTGTEDIYVAQGQGIFTGAALPEPETVTPTISAGFWWSRISLLSPDLHFLRKLVENLSEETLVWEIKYNKFNLL